MTKREANNTAYGVNALCQDNYFRSGNVVAVAVPVLGRVWGVKVSNRNTGTARIATRSFEAFTFIEGVSRGVQE